MEKHKPNSEEFITSMQEKMNQLQKDVLYLKEVQKRLHKMVKNSKDLSVYYHSSWIADHQTPQTNKYFEILGQDPLYNLLQEEYSEKMKLLKTLAKDIKV